jgi:hypothetical protein
MKCHLCILLALPFLEACWIVPEDARPTVEVNAQAASEYNFRGMTNNERGVLQTDMAIDLPTKLETSSVTLKAWSNFDLSNDVGDAWFPDGHAGEPSQIDLLASYSETYRGFDITSGLVSYVPQNADDFPFVEERGETKEFFVDIAHPGPFGIVPSLTLHYDFDEVEGWYLNTAVARGFPINEKLALDLRLSLGHSDSRQSDWNYGLRASGLADLQGSGRLTYQLDKNTTLHLSVNGSTIVDSDLRDWFDVLGIDADTYWAGIGVRWTY